MDATSKWLLTEAEKESYITTLTPYLTLLRAQTDVSQEELANLIGVSRQTYNSIERKVRRMSWNTYLSLLFFFVCNQNTNKLLQQLQIFPNQLIQLFESNGS